jgi:hydrogenase maturation protease
MNQPLVDRIVHAVLYEGYILYPYRPSVKNHCRWTFGGIYPQAYIQANPGADLSMMQTQCIVSGSDASTIRATIRFLHLMQRTSEPDGQTWQEAVEREVPIDAASLLNLCQQPRSHAFSFPHRTLSEHNGNVAIQREQQSIDGAIELSAEKKSEGVFQLTVRIENETELDARHCNDRDQALLRSFASTHTILNVMAGEFTSLTDPPQPLAGFASQCRNIGCWPVLVGDAGETDTLLSSPIILYDYPQIAAESPGDLFDGTEIDEILSLRIMTLTDEEKRQAAATDDRVRQMLLRTDALARDQLMKLHGTIRGLTPVAPEQRHA